MIGRPVLGSFAADFDLRLAEAGLGDLLGGWEV
jgi:hypothetical protein